MLQAGQLLAHLLMAAGAGDRPVTLLAYSMGARLAFHCLLELCRANAQARALHTRPALLHDSVFMLNGEVRSVFLRLIVAQLDAHEHASRRSSRCQTCIASW